MNIAGSKPKVSGPIGEGELKYRRWSFEENVLDQGGSRENQHEYGEPPNEAHPPHHSTTHIHVTGSVNILVTVFWASRYFLLQAAASCPGGAER